MLNTKYIINQIPLLLTCPNNYGEVNTFNQNKNLMIVYVRVYAKVHF